MKNLKKHLKTFKAWAIKLSNGEIIAVDKMLHFTTQFMLSIVFSIPLTLFLIKIDFLNSGMFVILLTIFNLILAIGKELLDKHVKKTEFSTKDMLFGLAGGFLSIYLLLAIFYIIIK